jgi:hypothetical protein
MSIPSHSNRNRTPFSFGEPCHCTRDRGIIGDSTTGNANDLEPLNIRFDLPQTAGVDPFRIEPVLPALFEKRLQPLNLGRVRRDDELAALLRTA